VFGSIGISTATALITQYTQKRQTYLSAWMTPLNQPFNTLTQSIESTLRSTGHAAATLQQTATGLIYQTYRTQAQVLAYCDVFYVCAIAAFCMVPIAMLFSNYKPSKSAAAPAAH
jgi:DHA2 family multidrug resistance protein